MFLAPYRPVLFLYRCHFLVPYRLNSVSIVLIGVGSSLLQVLPHDYLQHRKVHGEKNTGPVPFPSGLVKKNYNCSKFATYNMTATPCRITLLPHRTAPHRTILLLHCTAPYHITTTPCHTQHHYCRPLQHCHQHTLIHGYYTKPYNLTKIPHRTTFLQYQTVQHGYYTLQHDCNTTPYNILKTPLILLRSITILQHWKASQE